MTPEQKLSALMSAAASPAPNGYGFSAVLAERIARRRAIYSVLTLLPVALAAAAVLWALQDVLADRLSLTAFAPVAPGLMALALALATAFGGRFLVGVLVRR
ncbi:hypothetical protein [Caulobacter sp. NIBR2454]|uniref:hypothetical protein n=1 Tax=Caulobacter sp. NIBR2454 TaxID=3015996 RepID=UPI0022B643D1|nr:hypothetical protein [Caulobacter sp. NIBR2454]